MRLTNEVMRSDVKKTIYGYMNMLTFETVYVGITANSLKKRDWAHRHGKTQNDFFHALLKKYPTVFRLYVIEVVKGDASGKEEYWIRKMKAWNKTNSENSKNTNSLAVLAQWRNVFKENGYTHLNKARAAITKDGKQNSLDALKKAQEGHKREVSVYTVRGEFIKRCNSLKEAAKEFGVCASNIVKVACGERRQTGGYVFEY